ncbi:MAG: type IV toxin-antitoxin system AbiEi family antitoxin domain-containing protein [Candidatus Margulisiibacteriota bacterium]
MKYQELRKKIGKPIFTRQDLRLRRLKVFDYQLSLWQKQGQITKLKNGVYLFNEDADRIRPEDIALYLYAPSYISLEKALSIYGIIPEMVYSITSVTPKVTRRFKNKFGNFVYRHVKPLLFFGYHENQGILLADPEKALLDYLYLNKIRTKEDLIEMRLNKKAIKELFRPKNFLKYLRVFSNPNLEELCTKYLKIK